METGKMSIDTNFETGDVSVTLEPHNSTVWMTTYQIADMFNVFVSAVTSNLRVIFKNRELIESEVMHYHKYIDSKGRNCGVDYYNLDVIIALAFRMKGGYCRFFREWIRKQVVKSLTTSNKTPIIIQLGKNTFPS